MSDWYQDQLRRTNDGGAAWLIRDREEQRRRDEERRRQEEERRRREEEEERRRRDEERRRRDAEQQKRWNDLQNSWNSNSNSYNSSCGYSGSYSSDASTVVPWSSLNWFEKLISIPGIILSILLFFVFHIPCYLFIFGMLEAFARSVFLGDNSAQTPESLITFQILNYYLLFLKIVYEIVSPVIQYLLESAYHFIQSFLEG